MILTKKKSLRKVETFFFIYKHMIFKLNINLAQFLMFSKALNKSVIE